MKSSIGRPSVSITVRAATSVTGGETRSTAGERNCGEESKGSCGRRRWCVPTGHHRHHLACARRLITYSWPSARKPSPHRVERRPCPVARPLHYRAARGPSTNRIVIRRAPTNRLGSLSRVPASRGGRQSTPSENRLSSSAVWLTSAVHLQNAVQSTMRPTQAVPGVLAGATAC